LSIIPDIDILFPAFIEHRGPAHSIVVAFIVFVPVFAIYRKKAIPYFIAIIQHPLVGDYITGGRIQLFWPLASQPYGMNRSITDPVNIAIEWAAFLISIIIMLKSQDMAKLFQPHKSNLFLAIPTFTVLLPAVLSYPLNVPVSLIPPHIAYVLLFSAAIIITLASLLGKSFHVRTCL
jgi:membrane-bound metal-dependent hydrolase YbcI (DUF457 family)